MLVVLNTRNLEKYKCVRTQGLLLTFIKGYTQIAPD